MGLGRAGSSHSRESVKGIGSEGGGCADTGSTGWMEHATSTASPSRCQGRRVRDLATGGGERNVVYIYLCVARGKYTA